MLIIGLITYILLLPTTSPILEAEIRAADLAAGWVEIGISAGAALQRGVELVLIADTEPLGRLQLTRQDAARARFARQQPLDHAPAGHLRAWLVQPGLAAQLLENWPVEAELVAAIERVGPGARGVWISAGADCGIQPGMSWWHLLEGQPVARFDVLSVEAGSCFCSVARLAADAPIRRGDRVALWQSPGRQRTGSAVSAVCYVEPAADRTLVWVAAPRGVDVPAEPHLDLYHAGQHAAHAVVESMDDLFWYARLIADGVPPSRATDAAPRVSVGDVAVIRTQADIAARRFSARVFELTPEGALVDAGETDGLNLGDTAGLYCGGLRKGAVRVARLQRGYSVIEAVEESTASSTDNPAGSRPANFFPKPPGDFRRESTSLAVGDVVRLKDPPELPVALAEIEEVVDDSLFTARALVRIQTPTLRPLAVRLGADVIGVALVLTAEGDRLCGMVLPSSLATPLRPGALIMNTPTSSAVEQH